VRSILTGARAHRPFTGRSAARGSTNCIYLKITYSFISFPRHASPDPGLSSPPATNPPPPDFSTCSLEASFLRPTHLLRIPFLQKDSLGRPFCFPSRPSASRSRPNHLHGGDASPSLQLRQHLRRSARPLGRRFGHLHYFRHPCATSAASSSSQTRRIASIACRRDIRSRGIPSALFSPGAARCDPAGCQPL